MTLLDWNAQIQQRRAEADQALRDLLAQLAARAITNIEIEYDGSGDSGDIESVIASIGSESVELSDEQSRVLEDYAYALLQDREPGWEINEGSFGRININVADRRINLEHCTRYEAYEESTTEEAL